MTAAASIHYSQIYLVTGHKKSQVTIFHKLLVLAVESLVVTPPEGGDVALHGLLVVSISAGEHEVTGVDFLQFAVVAGYSHPPTVAVLAFVEVDF